jgi:cysteinyl-tRNA synthetase
MARRYLGAQFDIHGGGLDLRTRRVPPVVVRYLLAVPHYRSHIEVVDASLEEARAAYERIQQFVVRAAEIGPAVHELDAEALASFVALPPAFVAAMNDDLGTPAAVAVIHETVKMGNKAIADGDKHTATQTPHATQSALAVRAMADVLGIDPFDPRWASARAGDDAALRQALDTLVRERLGARATARAGKDYTTADAVRDLLTRAGVVVEDTPAGARWTLAGGASPGQARGHERKQ